MLAVTVAEYVIRDVTIGRDYSFLMDAYVPRYLYWEVSPCQTRILTRLSF